MQTDESNLFPSSDGDWSEGVSPLQDHDFSMPNKAEDDAPILQEIPDSNVASVADNDSPSPQALTEKRTSSDTIHTHEDVPPESQPFSDDVPNNEVTSTDGGDVASTQQTIPDDIYPKMPVLVGAATPLLQLNAGECDAPDASDSQSEQLPPASTKRKQGIKNAIRETIITIVLAVVLFLGINIALQNSEIISGSMQPTLGVGERVLVYKLAYKFGHDPQRGDIIVFRPPEQVHSDTDYIKRIIGMPGDIVEVKDGEVMIHKSDGSTITLDEPYIAAPPNLNYISEIIPEGHYFVMGDNRNSSSDSRSWGTVPRENIVGRAFWAFWPLEKFGSAPNYKLPE